MTRSASRSWLIYQDYMGALINRHGQCDFRSILGDQIRVNYGSRTFNVHIETSINIYRDALYEGLQHGSQLHLFECLLKQDLGCWLDKNSRQHRSSMRVNAFVMWKRAWDEGLACESLRRIWQPYAGYEVKSCFVVKGSLIEEQGISSVEIVNLTCENIWGWRWRLELKCKRVRKSEWGAEDMGSLLIERPICRAEANVALHVLDVESGEGTRLAFSQYDASGAGFVNSNSAFLWEIQAEVNHSLTFYTYSECSVASLQRALFLQGLINRYG